MNYRFQDRILDGPQFEDEPTFEIEDEDDAYERRRADEIDQAFSRRANLARQITDDTCDVIRDIFGGVK